MPYSVDDLSQHSGVSARILEQLAERLPSGTGSLFQAQSFRKKRGGMREIVKPASVLDMVSKNLHRSFSTVLPYRPPDHVHGFVRGRSILSNAAAHLGKACVLRVDLEDFFPSIRSSMVRACLERQGYDEKAANLGVNLVTIYDKLPIGLSTSPFISNLVFQDTDDVLAAFANSEGLSFTRYVDDLVFSGTVDDTHFQKIEELINSFGWSINPSKTAFMRRGGPQYVTGLYVGGVDRPRISRATKRQMRWILHIIERFGYEAYMSEFGGEDQHMLPRRLLGLSCHLAAIEPDFGYPLLRAFNDLLPESYVAEADLEALGVLYDY